MSKALDSVARKAILSQKNDLIEAVLEGGGGLSRDQVAVSFLREYFLRVPFQELRGKSPQEWAEIGLEIFEAIKIRALGQTIIDIKTINGSFTRILVVNDDQPFLVDSLCQVLKNRSVTVEHMIHPVMKVCRAKEGEISSVLPLKPKDSQDGESCYFESIIWCDVPGILDEDLKRILNDDLKRSFADVSLAVGGWHPMKEKLHEAMEELSAAQLPQPMVGKLQETLEFLKWLQTHHFTFLGYCAYDFEGPLGGMGNKPAQHQHE